MGNNACCGKRSSEAYSFTKEEEKFISNLFKKLSEQDAEYFLIILTIF